MPMPSRNNSQRKTEGERTTTADSTCPLTGDSPYPPNPNTPAKPSAIVLARIESNIVKILDSAGAFAQEYPDEIEALSSVFHKLFNELNKHRPHLIPPTPTPKPTKPPSELNEIKEALAALQKLVESLQRHPDPPLPANTAHKPTAWALPTKTSKPTSTDPTDPDTLPDTRSKTLTLLPRPSIIIHTASRDPTKRPPPHALCNNLNKSLKRSDHPHIHISSAKWTAKGNIVLTGGHTNTLQQLISAKDLFAKAITLEFLTTHKHPTAPRITTNIKWSKIVINNVPTGASSTCGPWTPDQCHEALVADNPECATLKITQRPSWVKPPNSYGADTSSSLVFAFEDPDGNIAQSLIKSKTQTRAHSRHVEEKWSTEEARQNSPIKTTTGRHFAPWRFNRPATLYARREAKPPLLRRGGGDIGWQRRKPWSNYVDSAQMYRK
ncbi:hypothetical protein BJY52DRAFT_1398861 [Lactarius psammicola]|nr:hypothetical protein BJY52DRAFT_1398861 [Lactarius psammicola]